MKKVILFSFVYLVSYCCLSQENVEGYIVDQNGVAIPGANILIMGTPIGTATDMNGHFKLQMPSGDHRLMFAYIKYKTVEQDISVETDHEYTLVVKLIRDIGKNRKLHSSCKIQPKNFKT